MITGMHGLFFSSDADATRAFIRDEFAIPQARARVAETRQLHHRSRTIGPERDNPPTGL